MKAFDLFVGLCRIFPVGVLCVALVILQCATGCQQEAKSPADVLDTIKAGCALGGVVEGVPQQVLDACAVIQTVHIVESK